MLLRIAVPLAILVALAALARAADAPAAKPADAPKPTFTVVAAIVDSNASGDKPVTTLYKVAAADDFMACVQLGSRIGQLHVWMDGKEVPLGGTPGDNNDPPNCTKPVHLAKGAIVAYSVTGTQTGASVDGPYGVAVNVVEVQLPAPAAPAGDAPARMVVK
jgi:hypothetical protein